MEVGSYYYYFVLALSNMTGVLLSVNNEGGNSQGLSHESQAYSQPHILTHTIPTNTLPHWRCKSWKGKCTFLAALFSLEFRSWSWWMHKRAGPAQLQTPSASRGAGTELEP